MAFHNFTISSYLFFSFSLIGCQTISDDLVVDKNKNEIEFMNPSLHNRSTDDPSNDSEYENSSNDVAALLVMPALDGTSFPSYLTQNYSTFELMDRSLNNLVGFAVNRSGYTISSDELHTLVTTFLAEKELNPLEFNSVYANGLQRASFEIGHRAAFKEPISKNRNDLITHYLKIAVVQKAVDTDAMADMYLEVESQLEQAFKIQARNYILSQSQANLSEALVKLEEYHDQFKIEGPSLWNSPTTRLNVLHFKDMYESAQDAINRL